MTRGWFYLETFLFGGNLSTMAVLAWGWVVSLQALLFSIPVSPWSMAHMIAVGALFLLQRSLFLSLYFKLVSQTIRSSIDAPDTSDLRGEPRVREVHLSLLDAAAMLGLFASGLFFPAWLLTSLHAWVNWSAMDLSAVLIFTILIGSWIIIAALGYKFIENWFDKRWQ